MNKSQETQFLKTDFNDTSYSKLISYLTQNDIENIIVCLMKIIRANHFNQLSQSVA